MSAGSAREQGPQGLGTLASGAMDIGAHQHGACWRLSSHCVLQEGAPEVRYTPVPEAVISEAAQQAAMRRIRDVSLQLALRSAATMHTFVQV